MAIMAGEAITEGGTSGMRAASAKRRRPRPEQVRSRRVTRRTPIEGEMGGTQTETTSYGPAPGNGTGRGGSYAQGYGRQARYVAGNAQITPGRSTYQGAILAEFLAAIIVISVAPIATGGHGSGGISPYTAKDLKRLLAIGMTYFLLALVPGQNGSRIAAWLGFLVLLVLLMGALNAGELSAVLGIFSDGGTEPPGATQGTGP